MYFKQGVPVGVECRGPKQRTRFGSELEPFPATVHDRTPVTKTNYAMDSTEGNWC
jgi:hypothetical protein